jgi:hypothetical protein
MLRCARALLPTVFLVAFVVPSASAAPIYESDFSQYLVDWWPDISYTQDTGAVTFTGGSQNYSTTSQEAIPISLFNNAQILLDVVSATSGSDMRLAVSYWTAADVELGWGYIADVTGSGSFGGLLSTASFLPPSGTEFYRVRLELTTGQVEVDNVAVLPVPQPDTAALLVFGLVTLTFMHRRSSFLLAS